MSTMIKFLGEMVRFKRNADFGFIII